MNDYQEPVAYYPYVSYAYQPQPYYPAAYWPAQYQPLFWQALLAGIADVAGAVILGSQAFSMAKKALKGEEILR